MFIYDSPIQNRSQDRLCRTGFSRKLADAVSTWSKDDSLVIGLYGGWGFGKSSVVNLVEERLNEKETTDVQIIKFNPWSYSSSVDVEAKFFEQLTRQLKSGDDADKDGKLIKRLRLYSKFLKVVPSLDETRAAVSHAMVVISAVGLSLGTLSFVAGWKPLIPTIGIILGALIGLSTFFSSIIDRIADFIEARAPSKKPLTDLKDEIKELLRNRTKKLLVVVDDIDRLTREEVRTIFKLVRINADFPNTVYLLVFEREVVEKLLEEQGGLDGKQYLEKIIQVEFDVPSGNKDRIAKVLFEELDRLIETLPERSQKRFDQSHWTNVYHSGFGDLFRTIRDVKRYVSSLAFTLSLVHKENSIEINPVDFFAIEALRVFQPQFYSFIKSNKAVFTRTRSDHAGGKADEKRKEALIGSLELIKHGQRDVIKELICRLFPQVSGVISGGFSAYGSDWEAGWARELKVCSQTNFETYFTFIPGGDEDEISQYEMDKFFECLADLSNVEEALREYMAQDKIGKLLTKLQNYTDDEDSIPTNSTETLITALFNVSDDLPDDATGMFGVGSSMEMLRVIFQVLKRIRNKQQASQILKASIENSTGVFGPLYKVAIESSDSEKRSSHEECIDSAIIPELQKICIEKLKKAPIAFLKGHSRILVILYRWKDWGDVEDLRAFLEKATETDQDLLNFLSNFVSESKSQSMGDYAFQVKRKMDFEPLEEFLDLDTIENRLRKIEKKNLSEDLQLTTSLFFDNVGGYRQKKAEKTKEKQSSEQSDWNAKNVTS